MNSPRVALKTDEVESGCMTRSARLSPAWRAPAQSAGQGVQDAVKMLSHRFIAIAVSR